MKRKSLLTFILLLKSLIGIGQEASSAGLRFVFAVDTSSRAERVSVTSRNSVYDIIVSGVGRQAQIGDVLALWPVSQSIDKEVSPEFRWGSDSPWGYASRAAATLSKTKHSGRFSSEILMNELREESLKSGLLTAFVVTDGGTPIKGTRFDDQLNEILTKNSRPLRSKRRPFVISLVLWRGGFVAWSVDAGGGTINIPVFNPPAEALEPEMTEPRQAVLNQMKPVESKAAEKEISSGIQSLVSEESGGDGRTNEATLTVDKGIRPASLHEQVEKMSLEAEENEGHPSVVGASTELATVNQSDESIQSKGEVRDGIKEVVSTKKEAGTSPALPKANLPLAIPSPTENRLSDKPVGSVVETVSDSPEREEPQVEPPLAPSVLGTDVSVPREIAVANLKTKPSLTTGQSVSRPPENGVRPEAKRGPSAEPVGQVELASEPKAAERGRGKVYLWISLVFAVVALAAVGFLYPRMIGPRRPSLISQSMSDNP